MSRILYAAREAQPAVPAAGVQDRRLPFDLTKGSPKTINRNHAPITDAARIAILKEYNNTIKSQSRMHTYSGTLLRRQGGDDSPTKE